jgi:hypothetical protein
LTAQEGTVFGGTQIAMQRTNHLWPRKKCTKTKKKGGLEILNLRSQNSYLRIKHLDKFFNQKDLP